MRTERLDNDIPQTSICVHGCFVRFLARFWKLGTADVELELVCKFLSCKALQTRNAVPLRLLVVEIESWLSKAGYR